MARSSEIHYHVPVKGVISAIQNIEVKIMFIQCGKSILFS
jgi:hypothetical protein